MNPKIFFIFSLFLGIWSLVIIPVKAETFSSPNYRIQWGNFNMTSGKKNSASFRLTDTVGQNAPGAFTNSGFVVKSGFQYIYTTFNKFSFKINNSKLAIDFGALVPNVGVTDTNIITISSPSGRGYLIYAQENHPLSNSLGITLPDTSCDVGSTCTETTSGNWALSSTYGFGFNAIGINSSGAVTNIGTSDYFSDNTFFRHFANVQPPSTQIPQVIMSESVPVTNHSALITYKVNISPIQSAGNYENSVTYTAVPFY